MNQPLQERLRHLCHASAAPGAGLPTIEEATLMVRLFLEHVGEIHGHDLVPWTYDRHGVALSRCQLCGREAQIFYRANRESRHTHQLAEHCPARQAQPVSQAG
jgi:hypothetical protein